MVPTHRRRALTALRRRRLADLQRRGLAPRTPPCDLDAVKHRAPHDRRAPEPRSAAELRHYVLSLRQEQQVAERTFRLHRDGSRCCYERPRQRPGPVCERTRSRPSIPRAGGSVSDRATGGTIAGCPWPPGPWRGCGSTGSARPPGPGGAPRGISRRRSRRPPSRSPVRSWYARVASPKTPRGPRVGPPLPPLAERGISWRVIQEILGHKSPSPTARDTPRTTHPCAGVPATLTALMADLSPRWGTGRPAGAAVFRSEGPADQERFGAALLPSHRRAMAARLHGRTAAWGGQLGPCEPGGQDP
jgi:hypothetical protein